MSTARARIAQMSFGDYRAAPGLNLSHLKLMDASPLAYEANIGKDSPSMAIGRAIHIAILEPNLLDGEFAIWPERRAGESYKAFCAENPRKQILSAREFERVMEVKRGVALHPLASQYFSEGQSEVTIFWRHALGVDCKSRIDWLHDDYIVDLKSARDVSERGFSRSAATLDYAAQMAFYHDAARSLDGRERKVVLLAVESSAPYDVVPYVMPVEALAAGRARYVDWLILRDRCIEADHWPGVSDTEIELQLPDWYFSEFDDSTIIMPDGREVSA